MHACVCTHAMCACMRARLLLADRSAWLHLMFLPELCIASKQPMWMWAVWITYCQFFPHTNSTLFLHRQRFLQGARMCGCPFPYTFVTCYVGAPTPPAPSSSPKPTISSVLIMIFYVRKGHVCVCPYSAASYLFCSWCILCCWRVLRCCTLVVCAVDAVAIAACNAYMHSFPQPTTAQLHSRQGGAAPFFMLGAPPSVITSTVLPPLMRCTY